MQRSKSHRIDVVFFIIGMLAVLSTRTEAAAPVNIQACVATPNSSAQGNLYGCPRESVVFVAPTPTHWVMSIVGGVRGWRAFADLQPQDQVVTQGDGAFHLLSSITVAKPPGGGTGVPPVVTPPVTTPPITVPSNPLQDNYTIKQVPPGNPTLAATFGGLDATVQQCFMIVNSKRSVTACLPPN